ncbi:intraflagellar transport protein 22 homolog [Oscarella lobularis]|uniref:intraflagellar transport protein 22 homolog n=1 Tax=Oscarella lobularis TaxID=121494 RepID=UPI00331319ED
MSVRLKLLVIGPQKSGKTYVSNFLSDDAESVGNYRPTKGVRILEIRNQTCPPSSGSTSVDIELWDCSGNRQYESCWPALWKGAHGALIIIGTQHEKSEIKIWHEQFMRHGLKESQLFVVSNRQKSSGDDFASGVPFKNVMQCIADFDKNPDDLRTRFIDFVGNVLGEVAAKRDREELSIVNN